MGVGFVYALPLTLPERPTSNIGLDAILAKYMLVSCVSRDRLNRVKKNTRGASQTVNHLKHVTPAEP